MKEEGETVKILTFVFLFFFFFYETSFINNIKKKKSGKEEVSYSIVECIYTGIFEYSWFKE